LKKTAFLFPGQGSQVVGMGMDLHREFDFVREIFDMTDELARSAVSRLCFQGPLEALTQTVNLQPAVTAVNLACLAALESEGLQPAVSAGHSLGEYSALCAAGVVSRQDTLRLVIKRGELMHRESLRHEGAMHALIGLPIEAVEQIVSAVRAEGPVSVANHNSELQIVITGAPGPVAKVSQLAKEQGAKSIPLKVSGAWHSDLMKGAEAEFGEFLGTVPFRSPESAVVHNVTADTAAKPDEIRSIMARQLCSPVRWYDAMRRLEGDGVEVFVEVGPGKVLSGLLKKILSPDFVGETYNVYDLKSFESFLKAVK